MKPLLASALIAVLGFVAAGCGSTKKDVSPVVGGSTVVPVPGSAPIVVRGTETIPDVKPGARVRCRGWPGIQVTVPAAASVVARSGPRSNASTGTTASRRHELRLRRLPDGSLRVSCRSIR